MNASEVHEAARRLARSEERVRLPSLALDLWMCWAVWWAHLIVNQALRPWRFDSSRIHEVARLSDNSRVDLVEVEGRPLSGAGVMGA